MNTNRKVGTLLLLVEEEYGNKPNKVGEICKFPYGMNIAGQDNMGYPTIKPIIICDDEIINYNSWILINGKTLHQLQGIDDFHGYNAELDGKQYELKKVLVLPNQFSSATLQAIVDGKVEDGDKVEVEMRQNTFVEFYANSEQWTQQLKLRKDGTAIIHPYKESVEEAAESYWLNCKTYSIDKLEKQVKEAFEAGVEWQKNRK